MMKRSRLLLIAALCGLLSPYGAFGAGPGIMLIPKGSVEIRRASGAWESVSRPTELSPGYEVRTQTDGIAQIVFTDGSRVELSPSSLFAVESTDRRESAFRLNMGRLKAAFRGWFSSRVNIRTPTAVCSVRGTEFEIQAQPDKTDMSVAEGHLEVSDSKGNQAVVTSEETLSVRPEGMESPRLVSLRDERAQEAARPAAVLMETARDQTRTMIEELRNRELKANEAQLGKDAIDAFGNRVRIEEYVLRPAANELKFLFLSFRQERFDWGHVREVFNSRIPDDYSQIQGIIQKTFLSKTSPSNWLKTFEFYATNTIDSIKETITLGQPTAVDFSGFGAAVGTRYYPSSIDYQQVLSGPGVPGGTRTQFRLLEDYNLSNPGKFTWRQDVIDITGELATLTAFTLDPASALNVAQGGTSIIDKTCAGGYSLCTSIDPVTVASFPSGAGKADFLVTSTYRDGSTVSSR
ncbi:MAG: FecR domain-containing protein, partial [Elusimicrobia bacterium]|nr:FecR domain-containing protein [Elusimicrobiota bacterium]